MAAREVGLRGVSSRPGMAHHEAAHAVVGQVLGKRRCLLVTIVANEEADGRAVYEPLPEWFQPDVEVTQETEAMIRAEIVNFFAGSFGQARIEGHAEAEDSSCGDFIKAAELVAYVAGSEEAELAYLRSCEEEARVLVEEHWADIERVALALLERETLTGDEMRALLAEELRREAGE